MHPSLVAALLASLPLAHGIDMLKTGTGVVYGLESLGSRFHDPQPKAGTKEPLLSDASPFGSFVLESNKTLDSRQTRCSDPNYPYINSCAVNRCCPTYAESCCLDSGYCLDSTVNFCCDGGVQCAKTSNCCGNGCCENGRQCCGAPGLEGCCDSGEECYQYLNGPFTGRYTCLTPAEASSVFNTIRSTIYETATVLPGTGNGQQPSTREITVTSRLVSVEESTQVFTSDLVERTTVRTTQALPTFGGDEPSATVDLSSVEPEPTSEPEPSEPEPTSTRSSTRSSSSSSSSSSSRSSTSSPTTTRSIASNTGPFSGDGTVTPGGGNNAAGAEVGMFALVAPLVGAVVML